ncbi:MAG: IS1380 family transposase [Syntrophobacterales bacterium]|nr:IS1380 family transposase [Syntrophobacterales bacterium]
MKKAVRRKVVLREGDDTLVSFGGGILLDEFISRLGLAELIDQKVRIKARERGYRESEAILGLAVGMITGGECLDDLFVLREEKGFGAIWSHGEIPHPTTMGDFLRRFSLGHIRQLESVVAECFRRVYTASGKMPSLTLDIDSTLDEVHGSKREGARMTYKGIRALNPLMGFVRETGDWLHSRLRSGNVHTSDGAASFIREAVHRVEDLADRINLSMDSGFYSKDIVAECERLGCGFTITADQTAPLMRAIHAIAEEEWVSLKENVWVSEILYQPHGWPKAYRFLVRRERLPEKGQPALLEEVRYRWHAIVTNRDEDAAYLVPFHLQRATMENLIRETKYGLSLDSFPCEEFHANWIKRLALPGVHKHKFLKAVRYRFFNVAARVIRHGRYTILKFARGIHRFADIVFAYERIRELQFG